MANKEANTKKENNKNKKSFSKDFKAELKKVSWPTPKQLLNNTIAVITIVIITAIIVFVLDVVFETLNKHGIDKIKEVIVTDNSVVVEEGSDETITDNATESTENENNDTEISDEESNTTENNAE